MDKGPMLACWVKYQDHKKYQTWRQGDRSKNFRAAWATYPVPRSKEGKREEERKIGKGKTGDGRGWGGEGREGEDQI